MTKDLSRLDLGGGNSPQFEFPLIFLDKNYIFFTISYLLPLPPLSSPEKKLNPPDTEECK